MHQYSKILLCVQVPLCAYHFTNKRPSAQKTLNSAQSSIVDQKYYWKTVLWRSVNVNIRVEISTRVNNDKE